MTISLAVALDRYGWRDGRDDPGPLFEARYWAGLAREADDARLDLVTFEDTFGPPADGPARPDAVLVASSVAPLTSHVGLMPVATTTHTEPFHLATALATLDHISGGRAGWQVRVSAAPAEAKLLGRREPLPTDELFAEAADAVEVVRRLWDSWDDDAIIRDVATGRFVDRERLHYIDFDGTYFSVKGPSIVPRSPQGQLPVAALAHGPAVLEFAGRTADLAFVTPALGEAPPAAPGALRLLIDLTVSLADGESKSETGTPSGPADTPSGTVADPAGTPGWPADAAHFAGTPSELADLLAGWPGAQGFRLRPARAADDLRLIARELVPLLRARGLWEPTPGPLKQRLVKEAYVA